jgi:hypothetical protein
LNKTTNIDKENNYKEFDDKPLCIEAVSENQVSSKPNAKRTKAEGALNQALNYSSKTSFYTTNTSFPATRKKAGTLVGTKSCQMSLDKTSKTIQLGQVNQSQAFVNFMAFLQAQRK